jgi:hypothetical protein
MRTALGVVAGYLLFGFAALVLYALGGHDAHAATSLAYLAGSVAFRIFFAALGGFVSGRIAGERHRTAALSVALVIAAAAVVSMMERPDLGSMEPQLAELLLVAPAAVLGDWLGNARRSRQAANRAGHAERS